MPSSRLLGLPALFLAACAQLASLGDYASLPEGSGGAVTTSSTATTGGNGGLGGAGGQGGDGAGGTILADWSPALDHVFTFDGREPTANSGMAGAELIEMQAVTIEEEGYESPFALGVSQAQGSMQLNDSSFDVVDGLTFGGWFHIDDAGSLNTRVLGRALGDDGFAIGRTQTGVALCDFNDGAAVVPDSIGVFELNAWVHVVCRWKSDPGPLPSRGEGFRNGTKSGGVEVELTNALAPFHIGNKNDDAMRWVAGRIDQVFSTTQALDDASVLRIYHCGITGERCRCTDDGLAYQSCPTPDCNATLPPCNQSAPSLLSDS